MRSPLWLHGFETAPRRLLTMRSDALSCRSRLMASITIRKLDDAVKTYLRLRSAGNGRSVEEEVRVILGDLIQGRPEPSATPPAISGPASAPAPRRAPAADQARVTLIIGGGIAAYKSL